MLIFIDFWNRYQGSLKVLDIEDDNVKLACDQCAVSFANSVSETIRTKVDNIIQRVSFLHSTRRI